MTTGIRGCDNQSNAHVSFVNQEHAADSQTVGPRSFGDVYAWISQHRDRPLSVQTGRGRCILWDDDWKIKGQWDDGSGEFVLAQVRRSPQDYAMTVSPTGDITVREN
ncbi:hypothetical protein ACFW9F_26215 [Streptomyces sp. NPDC059506]|uniref:Uncharacterized protein n=1 Tax=Streptomyces thermolineatus TaxID=44033 RepID=A0ABP5ZCN2_9ACTN|nr:MULTISPECIES: hypothetical protein [unclassified Streptomyces]MCZ2527117.1 hypothetical protein [Streptomyces sp. HB2AG]PLW66287.1 hypothetical protein C0036_23555 [Streptomyces sp. DJ]QMV24574.1 hypothetical protein GQS52_25535 [Streptomyces sp. SCUT-3]